LKRSGTDTAAFFVIADSSGVTNGDKGWWHEELSFQQALDSLNHTLQEGDLKIDGLPV
jgi:hypothetical protein